MDGVCLSQQGCLSEVWSLLASLAFIAALGFYSWWRRSVPGAKPLAIACLFGFLWMAGVLGQVMADDVATKIAWYKFQVVWQIPGATATTWFSLEFAGYGRWLTRRNLALLVIPPLFALLMIVTHDYHQLWWRGFTAGDAISPVYGLGAGLLMAYGWTLVVVNIVVLMRLFLRSYQHRWPVVLILGGQLTCRVLFVTYLVNLDLLVTPYLLIVAIMVPITAYAIALFGFRIFDPLPRARRTAVEQMQEGMLVLDQEWQVLSVNPAAEKILGLPAVDLRGKTWRQILAPQILAAPISATEQTSPLPDAPDQADVPAEIVLGEDDDPRCYEIDLSPLKDQHERVVGWLLLLHDITARRRVEVQRIREQQMLAIIGERERLARELHDDLGQVFAFVSAQGQTARLLLARGQADAADAQLARLVQVAHEADSDIRESILSLRARLAQQGLSSALSTYLDSYQQRHGIHIEMNGVPDLASCTMDPLVEVQLLRIIQEALTNVRKHAGAHSVSIDVTLQNGQARVSLQDDGCGFDPATTLHGSAGRLGLRIMQERAEEVGGNLELCAQPGQGTKVTVTVPLAPTREPMSDNHSARQEDDHACLVG